MIPERVGAMVAAARLQARERIAVALDIQRHRLRLRFVVSLLYPTAKH